MLAVHLLQNCMVYVNMLMLQRVLGEPIGLEHMASKEQRALTPLFLGSV
jgi:TnpA family transposase